jgi:S1-C subfamily serine protease
VLFFWTGYHEDYHRPGDTADKINVQGMRRVVDMSQEVVTALATGKKPAFVEVKGGGGVRPSRGPRLGIRPSYGDDEDKGVEVEVVSDGTPASRGGIKGGDRIVGIAGKPVKNLETYMEALAGQKAGSTIEVIVVRGGKKVPLRIKLD